MRSIKFFFVVSCTNFTISFIWVRLRIRQDQSVVSESPIQETVKNVGGDVYKKVDKLSKDLKYILLWTRHDLAPFYHLGNGQRAFLKNNCSVINCYVTDDRKFFANNLTKFDAIAFNGRNLNLSDLPMERSPHQKYIFFNTESADSFPVCSPKFEGFFNWTSTYKLDSDIPYPYISIRDSKGEIVGPKRNMQWKRDMEEVGEEFTERIDDKTKAAAWFVSHCKTRSRRQYFVRDLKNALKLYGHTHTVDVYGKCGSLKCPKSEHFLCCLLLRSDYFFYLSLENSFDEDYVTEKLLTALRNDVVPIVYGGANYSRFLPPGSYIDGRKQSTVMLAAMMDKLMHSPKEYRQYFKWKQYYTYHNPSRVENVCALCKALHDRKMFDKTTIYDRFRRWWNPNFMTRCNENDDEDVPP